MTEKELQCPKCKGEMVQGFVPDNTYGGICVGRWYSGPPKKSFWTKTKQPSTESAPIGAFRCRMCGFLEFYALVEFAPQ